MHDTCLNILLVGALFCLLLPHHTLVPFTPQTTMVKPIVFATALLGVCATASPLIKKDNGDGSCFNATIRKEFLLQITTWEPKDPYGSGATNVNQVRLNIADPTNQDQNAITCTDAAWNSTEQSFPSEYLSCSDPTISYKLTSYTDFQTFDLIVKQTFVQGPFSETILASYNATESELRGNSCTAKGCGAWFMNVGSHSRSILNLGNNCLHAFCRANKGTRRCTMFRRMVHHRPPSLTNVHQLLCQHHPTGRSGTPPRVQEIPPTLLPLSQALSASIS